MFLQSRKHLQRRFEVANKLLIPVLQHRRPSSQKTPSADTPADLLQWLTDSAEGDDKKPERLVHKVLFLSLASIHTSTMSACHALFDLCQYPEYLEPLRAEMEIAINEEGTLNFAALNKMRKLDSFLKESQRLNHPGSRK